MTVYMVMAPPECNDIAVHISKEGAVKKAIEWMSADDYDLKHNWLNNCVWVETESKWRTLSDEECAEQMVFPIELEP